MKNIYTTLYNKTKNDVKNFKSDFEIDKKTIEANPGAKFIHLTREHGTALIMFMNPDSYPKKGERVKYLFGTTNREELIKGNLEGLQYYIKNNPIQVHYFNGKDLKKIKPEQAAGIYKNHLNSILNTWEEEERQQQRRAREAAKQRADYFKDQCKRKTANNRAEILEQKYGRI